MYVNFFEKNCVRSFDEQHKKDIDILKTLITQAPVLHFYDSNLPIKVPPDASSTGLGTVLGQQVYDTWYWVRYSIGTTSL